MQRAGLICLTVAFAALFVEGISWPAGPTKLVPLHANAKLERENDPACRLNALCDRGTGCIAPSPPEGPKLDVLPNDDAHDRYVRALETFQLCRQLVLLSKIPRDDGPRLIGGDVPSPDEITDTDLIQQWNGKFLWEPASASTNTITRFGDEVRAVFGPIPDGDCSQSAAKIIPLQIDGNRVDVKENPAKPGRPLEFEYRDPEGNLVQWTNGIARCDKPSLAGSATFCGLNSRLSRKTNGNVDWLFFCRKSSASREVEPTSYWQRSNPKFALYGVIGFNRSTGEMAFFDGRKDAGEFDWSQTFVPPGGHAYSDAAGRMVAESFYDPTFRIECSACHDNKSAYVINPAIQQTRVGYYSGDRDPTAQAFGLGNFLPTVGRNRSTPLRVVGSGYTATHRIALERARTVRDPGGSCTECHTLTTQMTGQRFAADAVAKEPTIAHPDRAQFLRMTAERRKLREIASHRTAWASRAGAGKIHPWMAPIDGNDLSALPPEIGDADWAALSNCLWGAGGEECGYAPLYSTCPAPESKGDPFGPSDLRAEILVPPRDEAGPERVLRLQWRYLNGLGGVAQRDDVRFDIAVRAMDIPDAAEPPLTTDYPGSDALNDNNFNSLSGAVEQSGSVAIIRNASYFGHARFTEPAPSMVPRDYRLDLPAQCNRRYLIRIVPKRFCFDQSVLAYGEKNHVIDADIRCD